MASNILNRGWQRIRMGYTPSMRFVPAQVKEAIEISEETFRHWRQTLAPLKGKRGYGPCFSSGDLLSLKVVAQLHALGVQVRHLAPHAEALFQSCSQAAWFGLEDKAILFDGESIELTSLAADPKWDTRPRIVIPLSPLISALRKCLSVEETSPQSNLVFPLEVLKGRPA
ncbi:hypothetical protein [Pseudomonas syringae group genomosp. 3]|nr:hypothetical protein [Pseudomonas syringae group genomosp. 3]